VSAEKTCLTRHFLKQSAQQLGVEPKRISDAAMAWLGQFHFPGNVRQLENICHWLTVMAPAQMIEPKDLPPEVLLASQFKGEPIVLPAPELSAMADGAAASSPAEAISVDRLPIPLAPPGAAPAVNGVMPSVLNLPGADWESGLEAEAMSLLVAGRTDVWDELSRRFEARLITTALANTRGRRIEAAQKLGIGRNTITRKIQELGLE
jgi:two-component system nitrogen regulation response regulator GlnG